MSKKNTNQSNKDISPELKAVLMAIGRGLGTIRVYGPEHPSVQLIITQAYEALQNALKSGDITLGSFNGSMTIDEHPVDVRDIPIKTLEKRLVSMKISHLVLHAGLAENELKQLLSALSAPSEEAMKEQLTGSGAQHIEMENVKYVTLRNGERKTGPCSGDGTGEGSTIQQNQVSQIVAFLKGQPASDRAAESVKKALSDPEKLGQMILEAASVRQGGLDVQSGESLADIVIGCLRRTYDGLRNESEFKNVQGKANLSKAMMLLEKSVLDKIHKSLGAKQPGVDSRIMKAIREMEADRQFEIMASHYAAQKEKLNTVEGKLIDAIKGGSTEKAVEQLKEAGVPKKDWHRLLVQAGKSPAGGADEHPGGGDNSLAGIDLSALAVVLEKLEGLMQVETDDPAQMKNLVNITKNGLVGYADRIEDCLEDLEGQVELISSGPGTIDGQAGSRSREDLMHEISHLTLALIQPLTVVNASLEAATKQPQNEMQRELLDLAYLSGRRMQTLAKRIMTLVGHPVLTPTQQASE